jgi:hypothetical protein
MSNARTYESISQSPYGNPYFYKSLYSNSTNMLLKSKKNNKATPTQSAEDFNTQLKTSFKTTPPPPPNTPTILPSVLPNNSPYCNPYFYKLV